MKVNNIKFSIRLQCWTWQKFPGLYMKTKCKGEPTLILFCTGSYTIIGCKSLDQVKEYRMFVNNLLNHFVN